MPATLADIQAKYGDSVYPLYKDEMHAPYMENDNEIGYKGVVLHDEIEDKVQCSECGEWFVNLGIHIKKHNLSVVEYRESAGLSRNIQLCSENLSSQRRAQAIKQGRPKNFGGKKGMTWSSETLAKRATNVKKGKNIMSYKNKFGLCPAQIVSRLAVVVNIVGKNDVKELTTGDLIKQDPKLYSALKEKYGTVIAACNELGITYGRVAELDDFGMISELRKAVSTHRKIPLVRELKGWGLPSDVSYSNHFSSWKRAKMMAGLDQLLAEVKNG